MLCTPWKMLIYLQYSGVNFTRIKNIPQAQLWVYWGIEWLSLETTTICRTKRTLMHHLRRISIMSNSPKSFIFSVNTMTRSQYWISEHPVQNSVIWRIPSNASYTSACYTDPWNIMSGCEWPMVARACVHTPVFI